MVVVLVAVVNWRLSPCHATPYHMLFCGYEVQVYVCLASDEPPPFPYSPQPDKTQYFCVFMANQKSCPCPPLYTIVYTICISRSLLWFFPIAPLNRKQKWKEKTNPTPHWKRVSFLANFAAVAWHENSMDWTRVSDAGTRGLHGLANLPQLQLQQRAEEAEKKVRTR